MRFATRTFLWSFIPIALLLIGSFWLVQKLAVSTIRDNLRSSLRQTHSSVMRARAKSEAQNSRVLRIVGESAPLKAGLQLIATEPDNTLARLTVQDQLWDICNSLSFDFLMVSTTDGTPVSGVMCDGEQMLPMDLSVIRPPQRGLYTLKSRTYQVSSVPINQGEETIGSVSVGEYFDLRDFSSPVVLTRQGKVIASSIAGIPIPEIETAVKNCGPDRECEVRLRNEAYLSLPLDSTQLADGYQIRSLQSIDAAAGPVQTILNRLFLMRTLAVLLTASLVSALSSRWIVKPILRVIAQLQDSRDTGVLAEFKTDRVSIKEIRELTESFNEAAASIREGRENLHHAYVQFVEALASALDARDPYTAGHSQRVSQLSCFIGQALNLDSAQLEEIRVGALLHDIGKIGISDSVLQNPGRLTAEEFALIRQHPTIGRRILEAVNGFHPYLPTVELHHENWDGTGYPRKLKQDATPVAARIVHIADAYDAMTSDRPYRRGMSRAVALRVLEEHAGTQFDPVIVPVFVKVAGRLPKPETAPAAPEWELARSMAHLAEVVNADAEVSVPALAGGVRG